MFLKVFVTIAVLFTVISAYPRLSFLYDGSIKDNSQAKVEGINADKFPAKAEVKAIAPRKRREIGQEEPDQDAKKADKSSKSSYLSIPVKPIAKKEERQEKNGVSQSGPLVAPQPQPEPQK